MLSKSLKMPTDPQGLVTKNSLRRLVTKNPKVTLSVAFWRSTKHRPGLMLVHVHELRPLEMSTDPQTLVQEPPKVTLSVAFPVAPSCLSSKISGPLPCDLRSFTLVSFVASSWRFIRSVRGLIGILVDLLQFHSVSTRVDEFTRAECRHRAVHRC